MIIVLLIVIINKVFETNTIAKTNDTQNLLNVLSETVTPMRIKLDKLSTSVETLLNELDEACSEECGDCEDSITIIKKEFDDLKTKISEIEVAISDADIKKIADAIKPKKVTRKKEAK